MSKDTNAALKNNNKGNRLSKVLSYICLPFRKIDSLLASTKLSLIFIAVFSLIINVLLEATLRQNVGKALNLIISEPFVFLIGLLIVFSTLASIYLFKRRSFVFFLVIILWTIIISVNFALMCVFQRSTPFTVSDLRIFSTTQDIVNNGYVGLTGVILIGIAAVIAIALLVLTFFKCRKSSGILGINAFFSVQIWAVSLIVIVLYTNLVVDADRFDNLPNKYREHGFAYCFIYSVVDNGIDKPINYSAELYDNSRREARKAIRTEETKPEIKKLNENQQLLDSIYERVIAEYKTLPEYSYYNTSMEEAQASIDKLEGLYDKIISSSEDIQIELEATDGNTSDEEGASNAIINPNGIFSEEFDRPNVIFLQLESFYDVTNIEGYEYSTDPHPIYSMLKQELPGGKLTVPSIGAGTANTEFEIMTGMDVSFFGIAEYPYLSVLQNQTCESMAYNAREYGYKSHVIHNHKGTFYDRNIVFPNLGFDTFTSLETLPVIEKNPRKWCKDKMLIQPILECLESSEGKDLIYAISVQPHGKYPSESVYNRILSGQNAKVEVTGNDHNPENPGFEYYVNQLNEVDIFIGDLILRLSAIDEPTVVVLYGDHLPSFSVQKYWNLKDGNCYQTDYIIWNNCGIDFSDAADLTTYQLASYIFGKIGIDNGDVNLLNRYHLEKGVDEYNYLRHTYQYAIFEDSKLKDPTSKITVPTYSPVETSNGVIPTSIESIYTIDGTTYVLGDRFNDFSYITVNGEPVGTDFINSSILSTKHNINADDAISIYQVASTNEIFAESSNIVKYLDTMLIPEELWEETLDEILPIEEDENEQDIEPIDDATLDFEDVEEERNIILQNENEAIGIENNDSASSEG